MNSPILPVRVLLIFLAAAFLVYTTRFELEQQWPKFTLRLPTFYLSFPHSSMRP
ncbi:MAG: hypothetical protein ACYC9S_03835 [Leptospirales bacterium]